ncbi:MULTISPECIES: universal stress protein [Halolamina]|uniref:Nucleotide-binding universal stress protein, UspA family n=1 Tax=Halolamina pelagica TaxID=699431 RepID=A0A1I5V838_9EURY|nr:MULTISPECIES: universal stress protein [Halolamina]NHX37919.1 universal stress protein [Halolamina sp. R1-12]SFQ03527.1 Nucleotide-binding universal stress protein, UspA family [Halolamina pelagica]
MYDNILVPTDGSDTAEAAVDRAVDLAAKYDATVHALYVIDVDAVNYSLGTEQVDRIRQGHLDDMPEVKQAADEATGYVADAAESAGVPAEEHVRAGQPARAIRNAIDELGADLVVMGSHGRSGISRALLGSVAEQVLRKTQIPVLVVDARGEE